MTQTPVVAQAKEQTFLDHVLSTAIGVTLGVIAGGFVLSTLGVI